GIRYFQVTGVQTCALPISPRSFMGRYTLRNGRSVARRTQWSAGIGLPRRRRLRCRTRSWPVPSASHLAQPEARYPTRRPAVVGRSEERRVGKRVGGGGRG